MHSLRWRKVLRDLLSNKTRTLLVTLSIAVGVFAVGMLIGAQEIYSRDLPAAYAATNPPSAILYTEPFDDELVQAVRHMPEVRAAEGRQSISVRLKVGPEEWRDMQLTAIADYDAIEINKLRPASGAWPPPDRALLLERASGDYLHANVGETLVIETPDRKLRRLRIAGLVHDFSQFPPFWSGVVAGYVTPATLERLGQPRTFNELQIIVAGHERDKAAIQQIAARVEDKVEKSGRTVFWTYVPEPGRHWSDDNMQAMSILQNTLGLLALLLSGFLVINTITALLTQQVRQIGIMKAIGARARQIMAMYLGMVLIFGLLALVVAVPLGAIGAYLLARYAAGLVNIDSSPFSISPAALGLQLAAGLAGPVLAALYPVIVGSRITVREAIGSYGLGMAARQQRDTEMAGHDGRKSDSPRGARPLGLCFSRPLLLSLRNTFRRRGRLALTLSTLTLGGAIFISVLSVHDSLLATLDDAFKFWNYDVAVRFSHLYRRAAIEHQALRVSNVVKAESWGYREVRRQRSDGSQSINISLIALPATTEMLQPTLLQGRWLLPGDENALVINTDLLKEEPDIKVNDTIILKIGERETTWRVVGLVRGALSGPIAYANDPYAARVLREVGRTGNVQVVTAQHGAAFETDVAKALEAHFEQAGLRVAATQTTADLRARIESQFNALVAMLMIMAVLLAVVGMIGLMGTMSINVLERTREIGVMRAVGAGDGAVMQIVIVEGVLIGIISWAIGALLALPLSIVLSNAVGNAFLRAPLSYTFSLGGMLLWLALVGFLAALASILPAWNATRISVREVLAYE